MLFHWFDHPLIEAWREREFATSPNATSTDAVEDVPVDVSSTQSIGTRSIHSRAL